MITYKSLDQINEIDWESLLLKSPFSTPFQTPAYYKSLKQSKEIDVEVFTLVVSEELKALAVVTIMKEAGITGFLSRRGIVFGGPVLFNVSQSELSSFLIAVEKYLRGKTIYIETRNLHDYSAYKDTFLASGWSYEPYLNFQLSLNDIDLIKALSLFKYNRRREIKQSIAYGATAHLCKNEGEILEIYNILNIQYRNRVKLPLPSADYFIDLFHNNIIRAFIIKHDDNTIGGSFCPVLKNRGIYTYYYCGKRDYHKRIYPTHLAVLAAIEFAINNKIPLIDFMGAGKPDVDYGVRKYKSEFGGKLVEYGRFKKVLNPALYKLGEIGLKIRSRVK